VAVLADDEVVVHGNAQRPRDLDDRPRHVDVGAGGGGIARGMVVHQATARTMALIWLVFGLAGRQRGRRWGAVSGDRL
jgi:hypothetical protein